jgi:Iron-containing redox enzyme
LFPDPDPSDAIAGYLDALAESLTRGFGAIFEGIPPTTETLAERVPSLLRLQFLLQEQFDRFGGRFFHFVVPSPDEFLSADAEESGDNRRVTRNRSSESLAQLLEGVDGYKDFVKEALTDYCRFTLESLARSGDAPNDYRQRLGDLSSLVGGFDQGAAAYEALVVEDFDSTSDDFRKLCLIEMGQSAGDVLYMAWSEKSGDNGMVQGWSKLGFVVEEPLSSQDGSRSALAQVERWRSRLNGLRMRDYYYLLANIEQFPEMYRYSSRIAERFLREAREAIGSRKFQDSGTVILETFFDYDATTFGAKLAEIYEYYRAQAVNMNPWEIDEARSDLLVQRVKSAPFNQNDGGWLRYIANAGPSDEVRGLLFDVWSDEFGNGNPALHHGNLFTTLLRSLNITLPEVTSREYADYQGFSDSDFASPVFQFAISQNADRYFPEIVGMTLFLEWEVLQLGGTIKRMDYHGINSQFWRMHVGIDNAVDGHGAKARQAVELYLDNVLKQSGAEAMQREWQRIWAGFVAFAVAGVGYLGNDDDVNARRPAAIYDKMLDLVSRKQPYGSLNHHNRKLGVNRINDWFDDADGFLDELAHAAWVVPGIPAQSRLLSYLTTFEGPMYEVFSADDLALWRDWILWLGRAGDTPTLKSYQTKAESMLALLRELRSSAVGTEGHTRFQLDGKFLHEWFGGDLVDLMRALAKSANPWVVKWDASKSPLVRDFASGTNRMAQMLDRRYPSLGNQVGRLVIVRWINAGCPIPGEHPSAAPTPSVLKRGRPRAATLVEVFGQGFVH